MTESFDVPAALDRAVEVINEGGWTIFNYGPINDPGKQHCTLGAVRVALREQYQGLDSRAIVGALCEIEQDYLIPELPLPNVVNMMTQGVPHWNDNVAENADDVVHLLKRAAERARSVSDLDTA